LEVADEAARFVSRSALKLVHALNHFKLLPEGNHCLDVGASTGGFTQVLLERGAAHVTAIDVGHGQLDSEIAGDPRVTSLEGINARDHAEPADFIVCDVSFISLKVALPTILEAAPSGAQLVALIKPQFEAGRDRLPRDGIVKDQGLHQVICDDISRFVESAGWKSLGIIASPIDGGDGNREFLIGAVKQ
jgi:23S rRNA (cytidine1920-2'-O)/16S rRNA (cytidine1409-2'-O)-methyltransferase